MTDTEIHMDSAEEGIGTAILDMLAQEHLFSGVFYVSTDDDGGFTIQLLEMSEELEMSIEELDDE